MQTSCEFQAGRADRHANRQRELLRDGGKTRRPAHRAIVDVGESKRVQRGELQRTKETAGKQDDNNDEMRRRWAKQRIDAEKGTAEQRVPDEDLPEADVAQD